MQKVTVFSKTKFCRSRDIVIISVLHFMSKQLKLKLVSFLCLLSGKRLPALEATTLSVFSGYGGVWTGKAMYSPPQECPFWTGLWNTQLGEVNQTTRDGVIFLGVGVLARDTLKAVQGESGNHTANCRPNLGHGF